MTDLRFFDYLAVFIVIVAIALVATLRSIRKSCPCDQCAEWRERRRA